MDLKDTGVRIASGIVFLIIMIGSVMLSEWSYFILFALLTCFTLMEYHTITYPLTDVNRKWQVAYKALASISGVLYFISCFFVAKGELPAASLLIVVLMPLFWLTIELFNTSNSNIINFSRNMVGFLYVVLPFSATCFIAVPSGKYTYAYLLAIMIFAWSNDSFAYLFGSLFGKHKMFERVSPKKSWEGFFGGVIGSIGFSYLLFLFYQWKALGLDTSAFVWKDFAILALITAVTSTIGDFCESMLKRNLKIKDSGTIMPGHGGFLDRFDGLLFAFPVSLFYLLVIKQYI
ncbi:MAG: CDP-archaeol synthase [Chitinophagales bacterium]|nr:CDP-archaeol synthase [Chitinophagales bacterium]